MTQEEKFTLNTLQAFTGCDFEAYRNRGEAFRQRLSGAVLNALQLPDSWRTDCEMRGEWGGAYPVHLLLTRADAAGLAVELVSPSAIVLNLRRFAPRLKKSQSTRGRASPVPVSWLPRFGWEGTPHDPEITLSGHPSAGTSGRPAGHRSG